MAGDSRMSYSINGFLRAGRRFIAGVLVSAFAAMPLFTVLPAVAEEMFLQPLVEEAGAAAQVERGAQVGIVVPGGEVESLVSSPVKGLLTTLKQGNFDYSMVWPQNLGSFKGKLLVVPVQDDTSGTLLDAVAQKKNSPNLHILVVPMLNQPSPRFERFLETMGFIVEGSQYVNRTTPLTLNDEASLPYLPLGTFIWRLSSRDSSLANWGSQGPAALTSGNTLLVNWNWQNPLPQLTWQRFIDLWQLEDSSLALTPSDPMEAFNAMAVDEVPIPGSRIGPQLDSSSNIAGRTTGMPASPVMAAIKEMYDSIGDKTQPPSSEVQIIKQPGELQNQPDNITTTVQQPKPQTRISDEDSNPDALYDFDGTGEMNVDRATLERRRSVESQNAIAAFYNDRMRELADMQEKVSQLMTDSSMTAERRAELTKTLQQTDSEKSKFETAWFQKNYNVALPAYEAAKSGLMRVLFADIPASQVEGRAIWLDRGSIVASGSPEGLRKLIRKIASAGFNVIYFETINAGYPIYPSSLVEQNPQVKGWDPLEVAVDESHKYGMELHAWVWAFAVGNIRHNRLMGQPDSYPGPILSKSDLASEALRGRGGQLVLPEQYEYWLSPASSKARRFLTSYFSEIVRNYKVDGLQLDYIRYPFQKPSTPVGFEPFETNRFAAETGLGAGGSGNAFQAWEAWKAFQVTSFVKQLSGQLRSINPDLKMSAAVFPIARRSRMLMIQQDWETWVRNGWIDTLSPMAYSRSARSLERMVQYIHNVGGDKTLVYPGLSLSKLNAVQLLDTLEICRRTGVMGTTLFAFTQLDPDKQMLLQSGPYKTRRTVPPHRDPIGASAQLLTETRSAVDALLKQPDLASSQSTLISMQRTLQNMDNAIETIKQRGYNTSTAPLLGSARDNAMQLESEVDQWTHSVDENSLTAFQAKALKQMVDKVVRLVNYSAFQLAGKPALSETAATAATKAKVAVQK